jgi:ChpA-C
MLVALVATMALGVASSTSAQPRQTGLVNVVIIDNTVQVPIGIAANVCGVSVNLLAAATAAAPVDCDAVSTATADAESRGRSSGGGRQSGLINLWAENNVIQVPVAIAANICGVAVNILSAGNVTGPVTCNAEGNASATG